MLGGDKNYKKRGKAEQSKGGWVYWENKGG